MQIDQEVHEFLKRHLGSIFENDLETYHETTSEELTLYEWFVTPHRLDGLPFHDFMMNESGRRGTVFGGGDHETGQAINIRFDLSNLHIQRYNNTAIASYTLLVSTGSGDGVSVTAHNESRVMVRNDGEWMVVHVHKSPAWAAPYTQP